MLSSTGGSRRALLAVGYFNANLNFSRELWEKLKGDEIKEI